MLTGAVARIFVPGIKFDLAMVLSGGQGEGKSTIISKLGKGWSSDTFSTVHGREAFEQVQGVWLIEMAELSGMRRAETESVKHFISKQEDNFRAAYAKVSEIYKRQCVFFGTTNEKDFLKDTSGNRRFLPIDTNRRKAKKNIFGDELDKNIDQIWAEAVVGFRAGSPLYLSGEAEASAKEAQESHAEHDERRGIVIDFLSILLPTNWEKLDDYQRRAHIKEAGNDDKLTAIGTERREFVCAAEIWCECLGKNKEDMSRYNTKDINEILRSLPDWQASNSTKNFKLYGTQKYYKRTDI